MTLRWTAQEVARIAGGSLEHLPAHQEIQGVSIDSRTLTPGQLFVALQGERHHGITFVEQALERGAVAVLSDRRPRGAAVPLIRVQDPRAALIHLARVARMRLKARIVGITGSVGKTTAKDLVAHLLAARYRVHQAPKSYNNFIGLPLTLLNAPRDTQVLVLELGTNHPGEMNQLAAIARPHVALLTAVAEAHLGFFGSLEAIAREKATLFYHTVPGPVFVNEALEPFFELFRRVLPEGVDLVPFGPHSQGIRNPETGLEANRWQWQGRSWISRPGGPGPLAVALGAVALALHLEVPLEVVHERLATFQPPAMRMQVFRRDDITVVNDAYNANPASVENLLETLASRSDRVLLVLGDMRELGAFSEALHRRVARRAFQLGFRRLVAVGPEARFYVEELRKEPMDLLAHFTRPEEAAATVRKALKPGDLLALKASRAVALETLLDRLWPRQPAEIGGTR